MSVDERIRDALSRETSPWGVDGESALDRVIARGRRRVLAGKAALAVLAAAAVVTAVLLGPGLDLGRERAGAPAGAPSSESASPRPPRATDDVDGTWTSGLLGEPQLRSTLTQAGLARWATPLHNALPAPKVTFTVVFRDGHVTTTIRHGSTTGTFDQETFTVVGRELHFHPDTDAHQLTVYRWLLTGDRLHLSFVDTTEPSTDGIPGEVWQRATYTSAVFVRTGP